VHPFWSSYEEKWPWLELYMEGGQGELAGEEGKKGREGEGGGGWGG
jgi:hypothetical protein